MFDYSLSERIGDSRDLKFLSTVQGFVVEPGDVLGVVRVNYVPFAVFFPGNYLRPFDAVLRLARNICKGAERYSGARW